MPTSPKRHKPYAPAAKRHCPPEPSRQARRTLATNSATWRAIRAAQLAREPLCRICTSKGRTRAANHVDHIDGDATHDEQSNYQSLCAPCHSRKTVAENGGWGRTPNASRAGASA